MALKKKLICNNIEAEYWRIVGYNTSITGKVCQIFLVGYSDEKSRLEGKNIVSKNYFIKQDKFEEYITMDLNTNNYVSNLYGFLKTESEDFNDAEDI